jgi:hypothetical protein
VLVAGGFACDFVRCHGFAGLQFSNLVDPLNAEAGFFCLCDVLEVNIPAPDSPKDARYS